MEAEGPAKRPSTRGCPFDKADPKPRQQRRPAPQELVTAPATSPEDRRHDAAQDDDDSFHSVDEFKTPPRKTPGKKDGDDNYKKRFKELQKHARELVRRHAALEAELAENAGTRGRESARSPTAAPSPTSGRRAAAPRRAEAERHRGGGRGRG